MPETPAPLPLDAIARDSQVGQPDGGFVQALARLASSLKTGSHSEDAKHREAAVDRMHDRRQDFIESTSKHYTRHVVAIAGGCYLIRYVGEGTSVIPAGNGISEAQSFGLSAITLSGYWILIATYILICRRLLQTNYFMYASSSVTAAAHALACGAWDHAWFDLVFRAARSLDGDEAASVEFKLSNKKLSPTMSWKELLASKWSSGSDSLLSLHKKIHLGLAALCFVMAIVCGVAAYLKNR